MALEAIRYQRGHLQILDQQQLPHRTQYETVRNSDDAFAAIRAMRVRGAPAIAIVAVLAVAVELDSAQALSSAPLHASDVCERVTARLDHLCGSRPTAVNLGDAVGKMKAVMARGLARGETGPALVEAYVCAAERMLRDDVADNRAIGRRGAEWIVARREVDARVSVLTHCNTGSLATAGYGTALGIVRALHAAAALRRVYCTETRPYNQGSRLTAYELVHDAIPATLITDSMAAALLRGGGREHGKIAAIVVGADRVAANGDTANKIGTYQLAVLARHHGVLFVVAAPRTTIDLHTPSGQEIVIEERPAHEVTQVTGLLHHDDDDDDGPAGARLKPGPGTIKTVTVAAANIDCWNPAFDVTPAALIDAIVTDVGVVEPGPDGHFSLSPLFDIPSSASTSTVDDANGVH
ncbi:MAG: S-methyl-5-thioribose-1-phosphate isomerase [Phylliscum demangeonii]|nr:MAG: S-methyl-5-thioribose-1-phosphate isomerase [Phylliscum demangeonii]